MSDETPKFMHDCRHCVFLGHYEKHDLYYCPKEETLTARFDHDDTDCVIALAEATTHPLLSVAFLRAEERGLLKIP
jgi:hypothetical protein